MRLLTLCLAILLALGCCDPAPAPPAAPAPAAPPPSPAEPVEPLPPLAPGEVDRLIQLSIRCVDREYPNKPALVVDGDDTVLPPRQQSPAFYGCFDWHSAVHGHWAMVAVLKRHPRLASATAIREVLNRHLTPENLRQEVLTLGLVRNRTFERPYGWAWLLRLHAELATWDDVDGQRWDDSVGKLAALLSRRFEEYLLALSVPVRSGTHNNTAFAMVHALDAARATGDRRLVGAIIEAANRFYLLDRNCPVAYEPSGEDFISPCLAEAELMARVLPQGDFSKWLSSFLPAPDDPGFQAVAVPPEVRDLTDPKIGHLIGLMFQRSWAAREVARALASGAPLRAPLLALAQRHGRRGLELLFDSGYGGEHWLASFALYLLTNTGPYPPPAS